MIKKVRKGNRRFSPPIIGMHFGMPERCYIVNFGPSWVYEPNSEGDWNKLFGWSFGILPKQAHELTNKLLPGTLLGDKWIAAHHIDSVRVACRYRPDHDRMEIALYEYENGVRKVYEPGILVPMNTDIKIRLHQLPVEPNINLSVAYVEGGQLKGGVVKGVVPPNKWGYLLGTYFGGNDAILGIETTAPHDIVLPMQRVSCKKWV